ncbi:MAG: cobalt-precorrin-5B (C(1))-methyltransferase [Bacteroidetes bacterium]|nr:cobalt-precorrin-5B (C(1))-methyltransferase [Bacteroidota bacterium]
MTQVGVVLLAHGSRGDKANDGLFEVAEALRERSRYKIVEVGFMQRNFPTIEEAAKSCVLQGAETVLLIPYFLHVGLHMQDDLPETVELLKAMHPNVHFAFGKPFAHHPRLVDIVLDRIEDCRTGIVEGGKSDEETEAEETDPPPPDRPLRTGYTTGTCAAAAAKAAAHVLLTRKRAIRIDVPLPTGQRVTLPVGRCEIGPNSVRCSVIKDAGDDPDVTNGAEICVSVGWSESPGIAIKGGEGVGVVTKPGLELPVGSAAINPVPRRMIETAVAEALGPKLDGRGVEVEVTVPAGEAYARKTLNHRLGIVGGISILGTSGIVQPFSAAAYTAVVAQALGVAVAVGCRQVVLTTGRRTERFAQALLGLPEESFIQVGDFMGFALKQAVRREIPKATLFLMIGKLSKLAAGHFQTHVSKSSIDQSYLSQLAAESGVSPDVVDQISQANTARHWAEILQMHGVNWLFNVLCDRAVQQCSKYVDGKMAVECLLTDFDGSLLGRSSADA